MSQNKTLIGCLAKTGQNWHWKIKSSKPYFALLSLFWQETYYNPNRPHPPATHQANICDRDSLRPSWHSVFLIPPFQNLELKIVPPVERVGSWYSENVSMSFEKWPITGYLLNMTTNCAILLNQKLWCDTFFLHKNKMK